MPIIEVSHLHKEYGVTTAVDDVSFTVERGEIFGILGPNGAGKTTAVECIAGLRVPDRGSVRVDGLDPRRRRQQLTAVLGVQLQEAGLPDKISVAEAVDLFARFYDDPADPDQLITELGLDRVRDTRYAKLSGGQKQRLSIALALIGQPTVAILDELTTGLDPVSRREAWALVERIRDRGVTILLVTHFMEEAERLCDRVAIIDRGRVVALDSPAALAAHLGSGHVLRFHTPSPAPLGGLRALSSVSSVTTDGTDVVAHGTDVMVQQALTYLSSQGVVAQDVRLESRTLDDVFVEITTGDAPPPEEALT